MLISSKELKPFLKDVCYLLFKRSLAAVFKKIGRQQMQLALGDER